MTEWNTETAEWYARNYGDHATTRLAVEALELDRAAVIVDVGCGTGSALRHAASTVTAGRLIGIDPVPKMIELAREETALHAGAERIEFREGTAEALPLDDGVADVVLAFDSFDHWQNKERGLAEIRRILQPTGRLVVVKDGSLPGGAEASRTFVAKLTGAGFAVLSRDQIDADGVSFTLWICVPTGDRSL